MTRRDCPLTSDRTKASCSLKACWTVARSPRYRRHGISAGRYCDHKFKRVRFSCAFPEVQECHARHVEIVAPRALALKPRHDSIPPVREFHTVLIRGRTPVMVHRGPNGVDGAYSQADREVVHAPGDARVFAIKVFQLPRLPDGSVSTRRIAEGNITLPFANM